MDALVLLAALAGAVAGVFGSALPGLHGNTLAVVVLALAPEGGAGVVAFLVAMLAAGPFGHALVATFLGASAEENAVAALPAQQLAREGRHVEAVARAAWGALAGMLVALPLAFFLRAALTAAAPSIGLWMPWLLLGILVALVASEPARLSWGRAWVVVSGPAPDTRAFVGRLRRRGRVVRIGWRRVADPEGFLASVAEGAAVRAHVVGARAEGSRAAGRAAAAFVLLLSGALGHAAFRLGAQSPLGLPASPLLPLLAGLFALPALAHGARAHAHAPRAAVRRVRLRLRELRAALPGAAASCLLGIAPGVSASHVGLLLRRARQPEEALVALGAVNGGAVVFTLLAWHTLGKARSGVLVAAETLRPPRAWLGWTPPPDLLVEGALVALAGLVGLALARACAWPLGRALHRVGPRAWSLGGAALLVGAVALFNGPLGLLVLAGAGLVGVVPARLGVRRSHAMGVILVPAAARAWGIL